MTIEDFDVIRAAVEELHGCEATYLTSEHVRESLGDKTVWDGHVAVFGITGHPAANKCYGWSAEERSHHRFGDGGETCQSSIGRVEGRPARPGALLP